MATIEKYQISSGATRYRVRYRTPDNRPDRQARFHDQAGRREVRRDASRSARCAGEYVAPSLGRVTVGELGPAWLHRQRGHLKPSSYRVVEIDVAGAGRLHAGATSLSATSGRPRCSSGCRT